MIKVGIRMKETIDMIKKSDMVEKKGLIGHTNMTRITGMSVTEIMIDTNQIIMTETIKGAKEIILKMLMMNIEKTDKNMTTYLTPEEVDPPVHPVILTEIMSDPVLTHHHHPLHHFLHHHRHNIKKKIDIVIMGILQVVAILDLLIL